MGAILCVIFGLVIAFLAGAATMYLVNRNNRTKLACLDKAVVNGEFDVRTALKIKEILDGGNCSDCEDCK